jgi:hypothetical protein
VLKFNSSLGGKCFFCSSKVVRFSLNDRIFCAKCAARIRALSDQYYMEKEDLSLEEMEAVKETKEGEKNKIIQMEKEKYDNLKNCETYDSRYFYFVFNEEAKEFIVLDDGNKWEGKAVDFGRRHPVEINLKWRARKYSEIYSYEVKAGSFAEKKSGVGRAIVGGALFGGAGAVVGALTGSKEYENLYSLKIELALNKGEESMSIELLSSPVKSTDIMHSSIMKGLARLVQKLDSIVEENSEGVLTENESPLNNNQYDYIQELRELKTLVDDGIITEEDFEQKKKAILGLDT